MKISLFSKHIVAHAFFSILTLVVVFLFGLASQALANSQTVDLLDPSLTSSSNTVKNAPATIVEDQALQPVESSPSVDDDINPYVSTELIKTYKVVKGDTLIKVANKFGVPESTILFANSDIPKNKALKAGQIITILPVKGIAYKVVKGDTLKSIASKYGVDADDIASFNNIKTLKAGDSIIVPGGTDPKKVEIATVSVPVSTPTPTPTTAPVVSSPQPAITTEITPIINAPIVTAPTINPIIPYISNDNSGNISTEPAKNETKDQDQLGNLSKFSSKTSDGYIWPFSVGTGSVSQRLHADRAMDLRAPKNTPIFAIADATVLIADAVGYNGGYGKYVVLNFKNGAQAIFGHMNQVLVKNGDEVKQGDTIGLVGTTGHSTGYHLHLGMRGGFANPFEDLKVGESWD